MSSSRKIDRQQFRYQTLEDQIGVNNAVRDIDDFVESLDLEELNFKVEKWSSTGRPAAAEARDLLKLYIYGAMNNIQSTRELERQCHINIEVMWLICGQRPSHTTISVFRKNNRACFARVQIALADRILSWTGIGFQSLDGTKIRASNSKDSNFTLSKIDDRIENLRKRIEEGARKAKNIDKTYELPKQPDMIEYEPKTEKEKETQKLQDEQMSFLDNDPIEKQEAEKDTEVLPESEEADKEDDEEDEEDENDLERIKQSIKERQNRLAKYLGYRDYMEKNNLTQLSLTDADSRLMKSKNGFVISYNAQMLVDSVTQIITSITMTNSPTDTGLIFQSSKGLKERHPQQILHITTDKGYNSTEDMAECLENGIVPHVIMDDGVDHYTVHVPYETCEITERMLKSGDAESIKKCLRSGKIPQVYSKYLSNPDVVEQKLYKNNVTGYKEDMSEEEMKDLASRGFFVRDIVKDRVYCPAKKILRKKSVKANGATRYVNKLECTKCEARKSGYCTKSKVKEIDFPEHATIKRCQNWAPIEYIDEYEKKESTDTTSEKTDVKNESTDTTGKKNEENIEKVGTSEEKVGTEETKSSPGNDTSEAKVSSANEYKQVIRRTVIGTRIVVEMQLTPDEKMTSQRFSLSEHPFGTIKEYMGRDRVFVRGMEGADAEVQLSGTAYNMKRVKNLFPPDILRNVLSGKPKPPDYVFVPPHSS